ncbi:MAG: NAD-dependent epimerase/dehydratase family protein, partial [Chitinophagaceae bacterium]
MILVTGGTGFLGSHLLETLVRSGKEVRAIYRRRILNYVDLEIAKDIDWVPGDILDVVSIEKAMKGVDQIFHCAGFVSYYSGDNIKMHAVNVDGTANIVNACIDKSIKKLVYVSSVAAIGRNASGQMKDENCQWEDGKHNTAYGITKHEAEIEVWRGIGEGLKAVIVNPSLLLGHSRGWADESARVIKNLYNGFSWYTKGETGFVNVKDVAKAMVELMDSNITSERFILNGENWSYKRLFETINHYFDKGTKLKYAAPWMESMIVYFEKVRSKRRNTKPWVTHDLAKIANFKVYYDNSK